VQLYDPLDGSLTVKSGLQGGSTGPSSSDEAPS
jgi:hypothetical protein